MERYCVFVFFACLVLQKSRCAVMRNDQEDELLAVVTLFRHGDRAPTKSFPKDPCFDESYWPMGYGQLTNAGKIRMYELGKWFRKRYDYFLPSEYSPKDIYVRSTDPDRCLMSAYAVLAGLFPPRGPKMWNKNLLWQPIPVHTVPIDKDEVLSMRKMCPKYINLFEQTMTSDYVKNISSKFHNFFEYISKHSGWDQVDIRQVAILQTLLEVYASYNRSFIPSWTRKLDKDLLTYLAAINHQRYTMTTDLKRLLTGPFWSNLLAHFDNVINEVVDTPKLLMLSAHDTTIASILNCMDAYDFVPPRFGATVIWELRRDSDSGVDYIKLLYKKSEAEVDTLSMGQCGADCSYEDFKYMMAPIVAHTSDWEEYCEDVLHTNKTWSRKKKPFYT